MFINFYSFLIKFRLTVCRFAIAVLFSSAFTFPLVSQAQSDTTKSNIDTSAINTNIRIKATDSTRYEKQKPRIESSKSFYNKLHKTATQSFFYRQLYPLLFRKPRTVSPDTLTNSPSNIPFISHKNSVIRSIKIVKVDVFGSSVFDTTLQSDIWLDKTLNKIHFNTHDAVIRGLLQINEGDRIDPLKLADNERLIRQSSLFEDARFVVSEIPDSDSADLTVIVKDVFPIGFDVKVASTEKSTFRVYNRNILGFGHQLEQSFEFNQNEKNSLFFSESAYKVRNIGNSFTDAKTYWQNRPDIKRYGLEITKPFLTPETRLGGGINIQKTTTWLPADIRVNSLKIIYHLYDIWGGYSTIINRYKSPSPLRSRAAVTFRYYNVNYVKSPLIPVITDNPLVSVTRYIAGISLIKSGYFKSNMIFGFGKTEDIQFGHFASLIAGYETSLLAKRYYTGLNLAAGIRMNQGGFMSNRMQLGGFWNHNNFEEGVFSTQVDFISRLLKVGSMKLRNYASVNFTSGLNQSSQSMIKIGTPESINLFNKYPLEGNSRLTAHGETIIFTPFYLLSFRFAFYSLVEIAMIAPSGKPLFNQAVYPAIGAGIRIKNENLVFSTFQFGFTWYFRPDSNGRNLLFEVKDLPQIGISDFETVAPEFVSFK
ncbi:MAG: hypothetical protein H6541_13115 [Lentimicrobiaceae bacterium]|nr:hypothetical protein [Lentimicrobiaceae bacterium]MCO5264708.1 hypothetical protein [Lentimicrobium sp.]